VITARDFLAACKARDLRFFSGTPCSYLKPLINAVINDSELIFRDATNEGDAVAMAAGAHVGGRKGVVLFQNSGLGNAVNALTSLSYPFRIPVLLIVTHRAQPGGPADEPQHELMGAITPALLDTVRIPWEAFPATTGDIEPALERAEQHFRSAGLPYALVMPHGAVDENPLRAPRCTEPIGTRRLAFQETLARPYGERVTRAEALATLRTVITPADIVIATTGYTGRELFTLGDADNQFYMVGSMGSASAFALGLALTRPERRVYVVDGDGAALMRLGNLASIGAFAPRNLFHLVLDNEAHDSTGGQSTVSRGVAFAAIAQACGYARSTGSDEPAELAAALAAHRSDSGPALMHFRIRTGVMSGLGRPTVKPPEVRERLMRQLRVRA
jgi:phosphonopyruvate decarboxylase